MFSRLRNIASKIAGQWNGDEPGPQEDRAMAALELLQSLERVEELCAELGIKE